MKLSTEEVQKVAILANLPLTAEETEKYSDQLSHILDYIDQLKSVNTEDVVPTYNVSGNIGIEREDIPKESLPQEKALQNANTKDGYFVTKGVFVED